MIHNDLSAGKNINSSQSVSLYSLENSQTPFLDYSPNTETFLVIKLVSRYKDSIKRSAWKTLTVTDELLYVSQPDSDLCDAFQEKEFTTRGPLHVNLVVDMSTFLKDLHEYFQIDYKLYTMRQEIKKEMTRINIEINHFIDITKNHPFIHIPNLLNLLKWHNNLKNTINKIDAIYQTFIKNIKDHVIDTTCSPSDMNLDYMVIIDYSDIPGLLDGDCFEISTLFENEYNMENNNTNETLDMSAEKSGKSLVITSDNNVTSDSPSDIPSDIPSDNTITDNELSTVMSEQDNFVNDKMQNSQQKQDSFILPPIGTLPNQAGGNSSIHIISNLNNNNWLQVPQTISLGDLPKSLDFNYLGNTNINSILNHELEPQEKQILNHKLQNTPPPNTDSESELNQSELDYLNQLVQDTQVDTEKSHTFMQSVFNKLPEYLQHAIIKKNPNLNITIETDWFEKINEIFPELQDIFIELVDPALDEIMKFVNSLDKNGWQIQKDLDYPHQQRMICFFQNQREKDEFLRLYHNKHWKNMGEKSTFNDLFDLFIPSDKPHFGLFSTAKTLLKEMPKFINKEPNKFFGKACMNISKQSDLKSYEPTITQVHPDVSEIKSDLELT